MLHCHAIRLTREEGIAARRFGLGEDRNPYRIRTDSRGAEYAGYWASGWAEENGRLRNA